MSVPQPVSAMHRTLTHSGSPIGSACPASSSNLSERAWSSVRRSPLGAESAVSPFVASLSVGGSSVGGDGGGEGGKIEDGGGSGSLGDGGSGAGAIDFVLPGFGLLGFGLPGFGSFGFGVGVGFGVFTGEFGQDGGMNVFGISGGGEDGESQSGMLILTSGQTSMSTVQLGHVSSNLEPIAGAVKLVLYVNLPEKTG